MERTWADVVEDATRVVPGGSGVAVRNPGGQRKRGLTPQKASMVVGGVIGLVAVLALRGLVHSQMVSSWIGPVLDGAFLLFAIVSFVGFGMLLGGFGLEFLGFLGETFKDVTRDVHATSDPSERERITSGDLRYETRTVLHYVDATTSMWSNLARLPYDLKRNEVADLAWRVTWRAACDLVNVDLHEDDPSGRRYREAVVRAVALAEDVRDRLHAANRTDWAPLQKGLEALERYAGTNSP